MGILLLIGCTPDFEEAIADEWLEENAQQQENGDWIISKEDNPCIVFPNHPMEYTPEIIESCCDENGQCNFKSPQMILREK